MLLWKEISIVDKELVETQKAVHVVPNVNSIRKISTDFSPRYICHYWKIVFFLLSIKHTKNSSFTHALVD